MSTWRGIALRGVRTLNYRNFDDLPKLILCIVKGRASDYVSCEHVRGIETTKEYEEKEDI